MPIREVDNPNIKNMRGLHLYHFSTSNCSMRIRLFLEEKGIPWESQYVDLRKQENLTEEYFSIHPQGLVPALVDDGVVVYESADILEYLERKFPSPSFVPASEQMRSDLHDLLEFTRSGHLPIIKTWVYGRNNRPTKTPESMKTYEQLQTDQALIDFHRETLSDGAIPAAKINAAELKLKAIFSDLDNRLSKHEWILGDSISLADIAWVPQYSLFQRNDFPFDEFPNFMAYIDRWKSRPSYVAAIAKWMPSAA